MILTAQTLEAQQVAHRLAERDRALLELAHLLGEGRSTWATAGAVAGALQRFQSTAWPRIAAGHRAPRGGAEEALVALCEAGCPLSQRRVYGLLAELVD